MLLLSCVSILYGIYKIKQSSCDFTALLRPAASDPHHPDPPHTIIDNNTHNDRIEEIKTTKDTDLEIIFVIYYVRTYRYTSDQKQSKVIISVSIHIPSSHLRIFASSHPSHLICIASSHHHIITSITTPIHLSHRH